MSGFSTQITIAGSVDKVWEELSNIGNVFVWHPRAESSHLTGDISHGLGTSRHCDMEDGTYLDERVVEWDPNRALTIRVTGTDIPLQRADVRFVLQEMEEGTTVEITTDYALKYGLLGKLLDTLIMQRRFTILMEDLLGGLKGHIEDKQSQL